jgi:hypothetical protein
MKNLIGRLQLSSVASYPASYEAKQNHSITHCRTSPLRPPMRQRQPASCED